MTSSASAVFVAYDMGSILLKNNMLIIIKVVFNSWNHVVPQNVDIDFIVDLNSSFCENLGQLKSSGRNRFKNHDSSRVFGVNLNIVFSETTPII